MARTMPNRSRPQTKSKNRFGSDAVSVKKLTLCNHHHHRLRREIAILKKCRHPNVVRLREVIDAPASKKIYLGKRTDPDDALNGLGLTAFPGSLGILRGRRGAMED